MSDRPAARGGTLPATRVPCHRAVAWRPAGPEGRARETMREANPLTPAVLAREPRSQISIFPKQRDCDILVNII